MSMQFLDFSVASTGQVPLNAQGDFIRYSIITTGTSGPRIRVKADSGDDLVMKPGDKVRTARRFSRMTVEAYDGIAVAGFLQVGEGSFDSDSVVGNVTVDGTVAVSSVAGTVDVTEAGHGYGTSFASNAQLAANTPENIIAAAANTAGYSLLAADYCSANGAPSYGKATMLAKASAPATTIDGDVLLVAMQRLDMNGAAPLAIAAGSLGRAVNVASGLRLDRISQVAENLNMTIARVLYLLN